jgi:predicted dehydrogenase
LSANKLHSVLIIGAGNIAGGFDTGRNYQDGPLTHAGAYSVDNRYQIVGCVEPDDDKRKAFCQHWNIDHAFRTISDIPSTFSFEVVSICSPTAFHCDDLLSCLLFNPKVIFCEKPISTSVEQTRRMVDQCALQNVKLIVNHTRRWDPSIIKLKRDIESLTYGQLRAVSGLYNKGVLNNGSHMVDLLSYLLGPLSLEYIGNPIYDYVEDDPSVPIVFRSDNNINISINCGNSNDYALFELHLFFENACLSMELGGMRWRIRAAQENPVFKGYKSLLDDSLFDGQYSLSMLSALDDMHQTIIDGKEALSNGYTALYAQEICESVMQTTKSRLRE